MSQHPAAAGAQAARPGSETMFSLASIFSKMGRSTFFVMMSAGFSEPKILQSVTTPVRTFSCAQRSATSK